MTMTLETTPGCRMARLPETSGSLLFTEKTIVARTFKGAIKFLERFRDGRRYRSERARILREE